MAPWTVARQAPLSSAISQSLRKFMSVESVMLSNHLILYCPLLLSSSSFPSIKVFSSELALGIRWPKYWSFSFSISPSNECSGLISFRIDQRAGRNSWDWGWDEFLGSSGGPSSTLFTALLEGSQLIDTEPGFCFSHNLSIWGLLTTLSPDLLLWVTLSDWGVPQGVRGLIEKSGYFWDKDHLFHTIWESYLWVESSAVGDLSYP